MNNEIPKQQLGLGPELIPELIHYGGWTIWAWTGWKGSKSQYGVNNKKYSCRWGALSVDEFNNAGIKNPCRVCGLPAKHGEFVILSQGTKAIDHYACRNGDSPDRHMGQWLAAKFDNEKWRYIEINVDNLVLGKMVGGEYLKSDTFEVSTEGEFITEYTPTHLKELAKEAGLSRMYALIDSLNVEEIKR